MKLKSAIYWSSQTGAHLLEGEILDLWREMGAEKSELGYPICDETNTHDASGRISHFQHGEITWDPENVPVATIIKLT